MGGVMAFDEFMAGEKQCQQCGECKPVSEFHADKKRKDGRRNSCRDCHNGERRTGTGHRPWSESEMAIVRSHYARVGAEGCYVMLGRHRTVASICQLASRHGLTAPKPRKDGVLYPRDPDESSADRALDNFKPCTPAANGPRYLIGAMG